MHETSPSPLMAAKIMACSVSGPLPSMGFSIASLETKRNPASCAPQRWLSYWSERDYENRANERVQSREKRKENPE